MLTPSEDGVCNEIHLLRMASVLQDQALLTDILQTAKSLTLEVSLERAHATSGKNVLPTPSKPVSRVNF